jgi:hypothetical protein
MPRAARLLLLLHVVAAALPPPAPSPQPGNPTPSQNADRGVLRRQDTAVPPWLLRGADPEAMRALPQHPGAGRAQRYLVVASDDPIIQTLAPTADTPRPAFSIIIPQDTPRPTPTPSARPTPTLSPSLRPIPRPTPHPTPLPNTCAACWDQPVAALDCAAHGGPLPKTIFFAHSFGTKVADELKDQAVNQTIFSRDQDQ